MESVCQWNSCHLRRGLSVLRGDARGQRPARERAVTVPERGVRLGHHLHRPRTGAQSYVLSRTFSRTAVAEEEMVLAELAGEETRAGGTPGRSAAAIEHGAPTKSLENLWSDLTPLWRES